MALSEYESAVKIGIYEGRRKAEKAEKCQQAVNDGLNGKYDFGVDADYINSFIADSQNYLSTAASDYDSVGYSNAESAAASRRQQKNDLDNRMFLIQAYVNSHKSAMDKDQYEQINSYLDSVRTNTANVLGYFDDKQKAYSQFETEDDYNKYQEQQAAYEEKFVNSEYARKYANYDTADEIGMIVNQQDAFRQQITDEINEQKKEKGVMGKNVPTEDILQTRLTENGDPLKVAVGEDEYQWLLEYKAYLLDERKERRERYREESRLENYKIETAPIVEKIKQSDPSTQRLIDDYMNPNTDKSKKKEIKSQLKDQGFENSDISDILEYASGARNRKSLQKLSEDIADAGGLKKLEYSAKAIASFIPAGIASYVDNTLEIFSTEMFTGEYGSGYNDAYAGGNYLTQWGSAVTSTIAQNIDSKFSKSIYEFSMSALQSASIIATSLAMKGIASAIGGPAGAAAETIAKTSALGMFYTTSAGYSMTDALTRGGSTQQAVLLGNISGAIEMLTEEAPLEKIFKILNDTSVTKGFVRNVFKAGLSQMPTEAAEEFISQFSGYIADAAVMGTKSEIADLYKSYADSGLSESEAAAKTLMTMLGESTYAAMGGAYSGFFIGGFGSMINQTIFNVEMYKLGKKVASYEKTCGLDGFVEKYAESLAISDEGKQDVLKQLLNSKKKSYIDKGKLFKISFDYAASKLKARINGLQGDNKSSDLTDAVFKRLAKLDLSKNDLKLLNSSEGAELLLSAAQTEEYKTVNKFNNLIGGKESDFSSLFTETNNIQQSETTGGTVAETGSVQKDNSSGAGDGFTSIDPVVSAAEEQQGVQTFSGKTQLINNGFNTVSNNQPSKYPNVIEASPELQDIIDRLADDESVSDDEINSVPQIAEAIQESKSIPETYTIDTPERNRMRKSIVDYLLDLGSYSGVDENGNSVYNGNVNQEHRIDIVVGPPAAGKSSVLVEPLSQRYQSRVIDSDMAKELLPEFEGGIGANAVHRESQDIIDDVISNAVADGDNIVYPIVGGGKVENLLNKINRFKENGYSVYLHLNELPINKAAGRALNRYILTGRFIPPSIILEYGDTPVRNFEKIISMEGIVDGYSHWSNDVTKGQQPIRIKESEDFQLLFGRGQSDVRSSSGENRQLEKTETETKAGLNDSAFSNAEDTAFDEPDLTDTSGMDPYERVVRRMNGEQFDRTPQHERVEKVAEKLGRKLYWDCKFSDGYIDGDGNIHLAPNTEDPIFKVFKHDLTHYLERNERLYNLFANAVMDSQVFKDWVKSKGYNSTAEFAEAKKALYEEAEKERQRTNPEAPQVKCDNPDAEILADFVGENLFGGEHGLTDKLMGEMEEKPRRSFFETIKGWFAKIKRAVLGTKEIKTIEQAEDAFIRTYKAVQKSVQKGKTGGSVEYSYAGVNSRTADKSLLLKAQSMLDNGADSETVRKETGWFKGYDGKWRFEIDDFDSYLVENPKLEKHTDGNDVYFTGKLSDILNHKELFKAYPQLKDINIIIQTTDFGVEGIYQKNSNYITLSIEQFKRYTKEYHDYLNGDRKAEIERIEQTPEYQEYNKLFDDPTYDEMNPAEWLELETAAREKFYSSELGKRYHELKWGKNGFTGEKFEFGWDKGAKAVLMHEVQHAVQSIEDFASGASTNNSNYDRVAGEIESRDVEKRLNYSAEQRKNTRPDIDRTDAVFVNDGVSYDFDERLAEQLNDWKDGLGKKYGSYNGQYFRLGTTPDILVKHGAPNAEIIMYEDCILKVTGGKHSIALDEIAKLPSQLNDPILLFRGSVPNSFVALTEILDKHGNDVIVAVHINKYKGRTVVNKIASIYSKSDDYGNNKINKYVKNQIDGGNLIDASAKKAPNWFTTRGLQLPKVVQTILDANSTVSQKAQSVNSQYMQEGENYTEPNTDGSGVQYSISEKSRNSNKSLEIYTEEQYNNFGWVSYNDVITATERQVLLSRYADYKHNKDRYPTTKFGEAVIHSTECPDVIMYVKGDIGNPQITKIVRINAYDSEDISTIRERIIVNEYKQVSLPYQDVTNCFGSEILSLCHKRDYESFREYLAGQERRDSQTSNNDSGEQRDRARGIQQNKADDRADLNEESAFSLPENENKVSYSIPSRTAADLLDQYERGEITKEEYLARITKQRTETPGQIARLTPEDASTTPKAPEVTDDGELTGDSSFYENAREKSKFVNETVKQIITDDRFIKHYAAITNKETLETAAKKLNEGGKRFVEAWAVKPEQSMTAEDIAVGLILIERYQTAGDSASAVNVMRKLRMAGTKAGQTVQAFSMLGRLDPATMQMYMQGELDEAFEEMVKGKTQKWIDENKDKFELTEEEMDYIRRRTLQAANATDKRTKDIAIAEILAMVSNKIPPEKGRALKSLQRVCMLFNLKTQVRNILGNTAMVPAFWASDLVGSVIDRRISKKTGYRTKSARFMSESKAKAFKRGAAESFEDYRLGIDTRQELDRFDIGQGKSFNDQHTGAASILNPVSKVLNRIDQLDSFLLDLGDRPFFEYWFTNSLENQMRLNDVTEPTAEMMEIAEQEALTRVWQDNNKFTESVKKFKGVLNNIGVEGYGMGDVLIKFVKTPANLTKAMVDFSPIGLMRGLKDTHAFHTALKTGHGNIQLMQYQMVKSLSNGIVGTLMYTAFFALAAGLVKSIKIKGASDDDDDVKDFEKNVLGEYPYTITIGDKSFSYEWMAPIGAMMATSASIVDAVEEGGDLGTVIKNGVRDAAEVLFNQSFMQNIQEVMTNSEGPVVGAAQAILDEPAVLIPQLMSQVASMLDDESRQTYQKNDTWQTLINTIKYKIPGLRNMLEPTVDALGREVENPRGDFFNAFINPANVYSSNPTETSEEVYRLYESTGDAGVIYPKAPRTVKNGDANFTLTIKDRNQYQTTLGKTADGNIASLMKLGAYKEMTDEERVNVIKDIYSYAQHVAKAEYLNDDSVLTGKERKMKILEEDGIMSAAEYLMLTQEADTDGNGYLTEKELNAALNNYINDKKMRAFVKKLYGAKNDEIDGIAESYNN